jgi:hypothetical protein
MRRQKGKGLSQTLHQGLFEVVPKGGYDLRFNVETDHRVNSDDVTHIPSQSVRIAIE